ncbi:MAG TPA: ADOP family duplicated permease [Gemmatimonadaceae bacterium]|nr:ADOP family duplicated permease [Gemmatimonadaceae bacterium]
MRDAPKYRRLFELRLGGARRSALEMDLEIESHIAMRIADLVRQGLTPEAARIAALARFGNFDAARARLQAGAYQRDRMLSQRDRLGVVLADLRYAVRQARRTPGFVAAVVVTLALGIGANTAMFSIVDRLLFRAPTMLRHPSLSHRIYLADAYRGQTSYSAYIPYARYIDFTKSTTAFSRFAQVNEIGMAIGAGADTRQVQVGVVTASFFDFFDAPPALGRYYTPTEDRPPNGAPVVVLSYGLWQTAYGGARDVLGAPIQIGATTYSIIGVAPRGFVGLWPDSPPAAFVPLAAYAPEISARMLGSGDRWWTTYNFTWAKVIAERKPNVSVATAAADLSRAYERSYQEAMSTAAGRQPLSVDRPGAIVASIISERGPNESSTAKVATWISGVAVIVWLIACANVANLLLARALRRRREIAVRLALGVSRARLASQLLTESLLLSLGGGVIGVAVAQWGGVLLRSHFLSSSARPAVATDGPTLLYAGAAALLAGLLADLAPMLQTRRADLVDPLKAGVREGTCQRSRLRGALLVFQGALSVVLLVGAGLFVRSLRAVNEVPLGYDATHLLTVDLSMRGVSLDSAQNIALRQRLIEAAESHPDVTSATRQLSVPFLSHWAVQLYVPGIDSVARLGQFELNAVSSEYFKTMGTRILAGRAIGPADRDGSPQVMVVSQAMAKMLWPGRNPIGQCVRVQADTLPCTYVVGVAEDIKVRELDNDPGLFYYLSAAQFHPDAGGLFVRTRRPANEVQADIRTHLQRVMPGTSYVEVWPMSELVGEQSRSWRLGATMFVVFGALALLIAAIGLYSAVAYNVAQRTHELGVRAALGARMQDLTRLVVRETMQVTLLGVALGTAIALVAAPWVAPLLFRESPRDPWVFGVVAGVVFVVAAIASVLPAQRAARADPMWALRSD